MLKKSIYTLVALAVIGLATPAKAADVLIINLDVVYANSLVGKSLIAQVQKKVKAIKAQHDKTQKELETEAKKIESQKNLLPQDALRDKTDKLRLNEIAKSQELQQEIRKVESGKASANEQILKVLSPILKDIMNEKKATIVVDRRSILIGSPDADITAEAVKRLDSKIKSVKLEAPKKN